MPKMNDFRAACLKKSADDVHRYIVPVKQDWMPSRNGHDVSDDTLLSSNDQFLSLNDFAFA